MNLDQIAGELRQMPDAALQQQANAPGAVPGYLVADEIQRRIQARKAPQQQGNGQSKPTILSILANNLAAPQSPVTRPQPQVPFPPVPQNNLAVQSTMPQHLDTGGKVFDPSTLYSDVPVGAGSGSAGDIQTGDLATMDAPGPMPATPSRNVPAWSETVPNGVGGNSAGAYQPPVTKYPETSTSPIQDPPNTHKGGRGFIETLTSLAPAMQYLGNIGAAAARPGGNFASGVGYANEQMQAQQNEKAKQDMLRQEMAIRSQNMALESQKVQQGALMGGAKFVGPNGQVQEPPVNAPTSNINGVPMGGGQIAGSGNVPMNPQMTQMTGLPGYGGRQMDYSDIMTPAKAQQIALQNREAEQANQAGLEVAKAQALWIHMPKELAGSGFSEGQLVPPSVVEARMKEMNPALESHWETNDQGDTTLLVRNPVDGSVKTQSFKGVGPNKDQLTAAQQSMADHRDAVLAASIARAGASAENKGTQYFSVPSDPNDPNSPRTLQAVHPGEQIPAGALSSSQAGSQQIASAKDLKGGQAAINFANKYLASGKFTGPDDEALMEKYFELAKPSSGFRMSQPQQQMLKDSQDWKNSIQGRIYHWTTGTWFSPEQRQQIVHTMNSLEEAKPGIKGTPSSIGGGAPAKPSVGEVRDGYKYNGGDPASPSSWSKE